jgi:hypothetical protein
LNWISRGLFTITTPIHVRIQTLSCAPGNSKKASGSFPKTINTVVIVKRPLVILDRIDGLVVKLLGYSTVIDTGSNANSSVHGDNELHGGATERVSDHSGGVTGCV